MAKAVKKKASPKPNKYNITVNTSLTADEVFKLAIDTPIKKEKPKQK